MGIANSSVSSSSVTILSNITPTSVTNTIFLSTTPTSIVAGAHTVEAISTWDSDSPAERSSTTVIIPTEPELTELQNGVIFQRDEAEADDQGGSAPTQYNSRQISLTKRDRPKGKPNNESPAIQSTSQHLKGVTPPHLSLTGRRHVKEISRLGLGRHNIYHTIHVYPPQYVEDDTSHSTVQLTGKHHLKSFPPPVSGTQQVSLEIDASFLEDVATSEEYTTPFGDDVDIPPELDSIELKRQSIPPEEPRAANPRQKSTAPKDAAPTSRKVNLPPTPSGTIPLIASKQIVRPQDELPTPHKPAHRHRAHRNSAVPLGIPTPPKRNSAVPQDRPSTSSRTKRDLAPAQQVLTPEPDFPSQQHPLTAQEKAPKQHRRQKSPQDQIKPASRTVAHPPPKETGRVRWTVTNPPPRKKGGTYSFEDLPASNRRERMRLSHYPTRKIQLFGRRRGGGDSSGSGSGSGEAGWKGAD
jgi:hypothetical protein